MAVKISVVIPTYNRARLVRQAVDSVLAQTRPPHEIIVVDDGSTDATRAVLDDLIVAGSVVYRGTEHTGMPGAARNRGTELARGEYIAFLDSDDLWYPQKLERQMAACKGNDGGDVAAARNRVSEKLQKGDRRCGGYREDGDGGAATRQDRPVIVHTREFWNRDGREVSQQGQRHARAGDIFADALQKCIIGPSTALVRRDVLAELGGFREDLPVAEDYELWLHLTVRYPVVYVDEPLVEKRAGHGGQLSQRWGVIEYFRLRVLLDFLEYHLNIPAPPGLPQLQVNFARSCSALGTELTEEQIMAAEYVLGNKLKRFAYGAAKRGNLAIAEWYQEVWGPESRINLTDVHGR